jgi:hypothetical protein
MGGNKIFLNFKTDKDKRNDYFAETFRGLGQQMHLIEDASVPLHVRDDAHFSLIYDNYETWVEIKSF